MATEESGERSFREKLTELLNSHSVDADSDTPDFILAEYLVACLKAFDVAARERDRFKHGKTEPPGTSSVTSGT